GSAEPDPVAAELRRPFLMDPAGARPAGFAPPNSPSAPVAGGRPRPTPPPTPSRLAGPRPGAALQPVDPVVPDDAPGWPARSAVPPPESAFGPVSRIVTISVRTPTSRIDLVLPDRTTAAEVLETVLDLAPRSLREEALAHGGWVLRTAAGRPLPGSTTLLDEGVAAGDTLVLAGADTATPAVVHDDPADAVAEVVRQDTRAWPAGAGRIVALAGCAASGLVAVLSVPALGAPWLLPVLVLAGLALVALLAAGLLSRRRGDAAAAVTVGLLAVPAGAIGAALATAATSTTGPASGVSAFALIGAAGPPTWTAGVLTAGVVAATAWAAVGTGGVVFGAVVTAAGLVGIAGMPALIVGLAPSGVAALVIGLAVCPMPALPGLALRLASFEPEPLPGSAAASGAGSAADPAADPAVQPVAPARLPGEAGDIRARTRRAVGLLTALLHGVTWPVLIAGIGLALAGPPVTGPALVATAGAALLLRARLFRTVGQRVPLLVTGLGCLLAVAAGLVLRAASSSTVVLVIAAAGGAAALAVALAGRRTPRTPGLARAAEIGDLLLAIAIIPLTAAVLGAFAAVHELGG
ncbi:type VII secretion integral membrane protein EccD, partial [Nakamurella sp.]|uniref:type VII secretion integral membrane protein EccD n=1 Tax=Nakamurella sp. TaxID=1869182 RepID=UPI003B3A363F